MGEAVRTDIGMMTGEEMDFFLHSSIYRWYTGVSSSIIAINNLVFLLRLAIQNCMYASFSTITDSREEPKKLGEATVSQIKTGLVPQIWFLRPNQQR